MKEATYKVLDDVEQQGLRFRGLQLEDVRVSSTQVHRADDGRCVARVAATRGTEVLVAIAGVLLDHQQTEASRTPRVTACGSRTRAADRVGDDGVAAVELLDVEGVAVRRVRDAVRR